MKEATGELNMTVITVVAIAAVGLLFTVFVWPNIQANLTLNTACSSIDAKGRYDSEGTGGAKKDEDGYISCADFTCTVRYGDKNYSKSCNS